MTLFSDHSLSAMKPSGVETGLNCHDFRLIRFYDLMSIIDVHEMTIEEGETNSLAIHLFLCIMCLLLNAGNFKG